MAGRGRPSKYTKELAERICADLASGMTLRQVCRQEGMPDPVTVLNWEKEDREGFSQQYADARLLGYRQWADELIEIADEAGDWTDQRSRLRVDTRKWLLSKALPKIFGDKLIHGGEGPDGAIVNHVTYSWERPE